MLESLVVQAAPCGRVHVAGSSTRRVRVKVDGRVVWVGRGAFDWTGEGFGPVSHVRVGGRPVGAPSLWRPDVEPTVRWGAVAREGPVPIHVHFDTDCPIEPFAWTLTLAGSTWSGRGADADLIATLPQGTWRGDYAVTWRGEPLRSYPFEVGVGPACVDADGDGWCTVPWLGRADCDDADPAVHPGAPDPPGDGVDNDCDGHLTGDADGDGYEPWSGATGDCDDANPAVHPGAEELDDGLDDDCDGVVAGENPVRPWATFDGVEPRPLSDVDAAVTPLRTGSGGPAWLVVVDEGSASMGGRVDIDRIGWVVIPSGGGLRTVLQLDLGTTDLHRPYDDEGLPEVDRPMGVGQDTRIVPLVTPDGLAAGAVRYRWDGDALVRTATPSGTAP